MFQRELVILKYMGRTPFLASCKACHLKFFTPLELSGKTAEAQEYLQERFNNHKCRPEDVGNVISMPHRFS
jgi:hypothetical protein